MLKGFERETFTLVEEDSVLRRMPFSPTN